jgi:hypothetical protein
VIDTRRRYYALSDISGGDGLDADAAADDDDGAEDYGAVSGGPAQQLVLLQRLSTVAAAGRAAHAVHAAVAAEALAAVRAAAAAADVRVFIAAADHAANNAGIFGSSSRYRRFAPPQSQRQLSGSSNGSSSSSQLLVGVLVAATLAMCVAFATSLMDLRATLHQRAEARSSSSSSSTPEGAATARASAQATLRTRKPQSRLAAQQRSLQQQLVHSQACAEHDNALHAPLLLADECEDNASDSEQQQHAAPAASSSRLQPALQKFYNPLHAYDVLPGGE